MGLKGNLNDISLENIFQMLFVERKDGLLSIQHGVRRAEVFLDQGRISFAKLGGPEEGARVKLAVIKNGYLTERKWAECVGSDVSPGIEKILSALYGHVAEDLLSFLFLREMKYTFFILLQWREGLYEYSPKEKPGIDSRLLKSISGEYMLLAALREVESWREVRAKLPSLNSSVLMVSNLISVASDARYNLTSDEVYLAALASVQISLEDLLNSSKLSYCETGKIIEKFMSHRLLRVRRALKDAFPAGDDPSVLTRGNRWVEYSALLLLTVCLFAIGDGVFFDTGVKSYLNTLLLKESSEKVDDKTDDFNSKRTVSGRMESEKSGEDELGGSAGGVVKEFFGDGLYRGGGVAEKGDQAGESSGKSVDEGDEEEGAADVGPNVEELTERAVNGEVDAQLSLGLLYDFGKGGVEEDDARAAAWYLRAAEEGFHPEAQFNLGVMYKNGEGVEKNSAEAARWYGKSASQGNSHARYNLALMYLEGEGVAQDKEKAVELLYESGVSFLNDGNDDALFQVVNVLRKIDPDSIAAKKLLVRAGEKK